MLAHSLTAAIDEDNNLIQALEYPLATDDPRPARRLESLLFGGDATPGAVAADDFYGVIRSDVLRRVRPHDSFYHADQTFMSELALLGPFAIVPDWLYFRRHHSGRAFKANPSVRSWCANLDPKRSDGLRHPTVRLVAEYGWERLALIHRSPITSGRPTSVLRRDRSLDGHPRHPPPPWGPPRRVRQSPSGAREPGRRRAGGRRRPAGRPVTPGRDSAPRRRVGFFGKLGAGNYGNDGSLEALLAHLRERHPGVPRRLHGRRPSRGGGALRHPRCRPELGPGGHGGPASASSIDGLTALRVGVGVGVDACRIARWTRRHSVAIVPGMGTFESTMQVRPWQTPWSLFALAMSARAFGVSLASSASAPAGPPDPLTRVLLRQALRMASHRSFRTSTRAPQRPRWGSTPRATRVLPDLAFALPTPPRSDRRSGTIGLGVIAWYGAESERAGADAIHVRYRAALQDFSCRARRRRAHRPAAGW